MDVQLIAWTKTGFSMPHGFKPRTVDGQVSSADELAEFAGRACYQSWSKPNPATRLNRDYLANIITQEHFSVMEHASATFYVQGVSRSLTHELIRHRHLSFSQLSQRFVDESTAGFVTPPALAELVGTGALNRDTSHAIGYALEAYLATVDTLTEQGFTRKQAREAARAFLPNCTETKIVVTGNMRAWRDFLRKRWTVHADAEIRQLAGEILDHLRGIAPNTFQDIPTEPYK